MTFAVLIPLRALPFVILQLLFAVVLYIPHAAGALNTTLRLDAPEVSFSPGWRAAQFEGITFAFATDPNERMQVALPANTSAVFYQGYKSSGGALFRACVDTACDVSIESDENVVVVDAHDDTEDGTRPPEDLFSFVGLDTSTPHVLTVVNLQDERFGNTSQITFDSLIVTTGALDDNSPQPEPIPRIDGTIVVTAIEPPATTTTSSSVSVTTDTATPSPTDSGTTDPAAGSTVTAPAATTDTPVSQPGQGASSTPTVSPGSSPTNPATDGNSGNAGDGSTSADDRNGAGGDTSTNSANGGGQTTSPSGTNTVPPNGTSPTSTPGATAGDGSPTATQTGTNGATVPGGQDPQPTSTDGSDGGSGNGEGEGGGGGDSAQSNNNTGASGGVSRTVIIIVAVVASLVVLALLGAIIWLLVRSQPPARDPEGAAGLMREAAPTAIISGPVATAPSRPQNPFADSVAPDVPLEEPSAARVVALSSPRPPPPPIPVRSPLRSTFNKTPAWINRVPRTPSPTSPT